MTALLALSPLDGRYASKVDALRPYLSEFALIKNRLIVEVRWLEMLSAQPAITEVPSLDDHAKKALQAIIDNFDTDQAQRVKTIESTTNHDVKAVEYSPPRLNLSILPALLQTLTISHTDSC